MDEVTDAASWPDKGNLQWNHNYGGMTTSAMNMDLHYNSFDHPNIGLKSTVPYLSGCSLGRQGLTFQNEAMQASLSHPGTNHSIVQYRHSENVLRAALLKQELELENASISSHMRQAQIDDGIHALPQGLQEAAHDMLQKFSKGSPKLPKLDRSPSIGSSGSAKPSCQELSCNYQLAIPPPNLAHDGGVFSSLFGLEVVNAKSHILPEGTPPDVYFGKGPWIDEGQIGPSERRLEQALIRQVRSTSQHSLSQSHGSGVSATGTNRPRTRARRGQATDPHSIAERKRRERISNARKELQELVPTLNKADKMALVDDVIEYVRFLQLQTKVFIMSRLGSTDAVAPLVAEISAEGQSGFEAATGALQDCSMTVIEEEVAKLMEDDMAAALQFLQRKELCLMPISLAAAISSKDAMKPTGFASATD